MLPKRGHRVFTNSDFLQQSPARSIAPFMKVDRTAVVIAKQVAWVEPEVLEQRREELTDAIES